MTEDDVREIVRDELARIRREDDARLHALMDQWQAERAEVNAASPDDGPVTAQIKAILRGEAA